MLIKIGSAFVCGVTLHSYYSACAHASSQAGYLPPHPSNPSNSLVFFDVAEETGYNFFGGVKRNPIGRIEMELFDDTVPITTRSFRELCRGGAGVTPERKPLCYKNCVFHRIIPNFMIQGGDITRGNGTGGCSLYGVRFRDESFEGKAGDHKGPGILSMANAGRNTNGSQFFICTASCPWLNGQHVVFGQVVKGYEHVKKMESFGTPSGKPSAQVLIDDCGVLREKAN